MCKHTSKHISVYFYILRSVKTAAFLDKSLCNLFIPLQGGYSIK